MFKNEDFIKHRWLYISRTLFFTFKSSLEQFTSKLKYLQATSVSKITLDDKFKNTEQIKICQLLMEYLEVGMSQSEMLLNYSRYLTVLDIEKCKMRLHLKYLFIENQWLKKEIFELHQLLFNLEKRCVEAEAEKKYFQCYYNMRNYSKTNTMSLNSETIIFDEEDEETEPDEDVPITLAALFHLVSHFISDNKYLVATAWCNKNVADFSKKYGENSKEVGSVYNLLGRIYKSYKAYLLAKEYFQFSLLIREKIYGKDSDQVAITLTLLGSVLGKLGNYQNALSSCKTAVLIRERIYGRNIDVAHLYAKIANFSFQLKLWNDVITNYKICLVVFESIYDVTEISVIKGYTMLSHAYLHLNITDKALDYLLKVNLIYIQKNHPGSSNRNTPISVIEESLKRNVQSFAAEMLLKRFGTILETLDDRVVEVMIFYYEKINKLEIVEMLRCWVYLSNGDINATPTVLEELNHPERRLSELSFSQNGPNETVRRDSISNSVRQSIRNIFTSKN